MRKLFAGLIALCCTLGLYTMVGTSQAGAAGYTVCPSAGTTSEWWIEDTAGAGTTIHCVTSGNHVTLDRYYGGTKVGLEFEAWFPSYINWFLPSPWVVGEGRGLVLCQGDYYYGSLFLGTPSAGWEHSFQRLGVNEGAVNHWHGGNTSRPYDSHTSTDCSSRTGVPNSNGLYFS